MKKTHVLSIDSLLMFWGDLFCYVYISGVFLHRSLHEIGLYGIFIVLLLGVATGRMSLSSRKTRLWTDPFFLTVCIFMAWVGVSLLLRKVDTRPLMYFNKTLPFFNGLLLPLLGIRVYILGCDKDSLFLKRLLWIAVVSLLLHACISFINVYCLPDSLRGVAKTIGLRHHSIRLCGFYHYIAMACFLSQMLPFVVVRAMKTKTTGASYKQQHGLSALVEKRWVWIVMGVLMGIALLLTQGRMMIAWSVLVFVVALFLLSKNKWKVLGILSVLLFGFSLLLFSKSGPYYKRLHSIIEAVQTGNPQRLDTFTRFRYNSAIYGPAHDTTISFYGGRF